MSKILFVIGFMGVLAGCASSPKGSALVENSSVLRSGDGSVLICRPSTLLASGITPDVLLNNELVAEISNGSLIEIVHPAGPAKIYFRSMTFNNQGSKSFGIDTKISAGAKKYLVMGPNLNSLFVLPIAGFITSGISVTWQVAEANETIVVNQCGGFNKLRIRA